MPLDAFENRVFDQLLVQLNAIVGPPNWLTQPSSIEEGVPGAAITLPTGVSKVFAQVMSTEPGSPPTPSGSHRWRSTFNVWICAREQSDVLSIKADVLRAVYAAVSTFTTMFEAVPFPTNFSFNNSMTSGGVWIGLQQIQIDYQTTDSNP
jgi:hypothetical protein